jgi:predicted nucleic acid-binding protein
VIVYFDTSALVPLLIDEPASAGCRYLWENSDDVVTCRLSYVEAAAALAQAQRLDRISAAGHNEALRSLDDLWPELAIVEFDPVLMHRAADLAARHSLRGYDAVHCAAAELIADEQTVAASGDGALLGAWDALGIAIADTTQRPG